MNKKFDINDGIKETGSHWSQLDNEKPVILIDFDHTIAKDCLACAETGNLSMWAQEGAREAITQLSKQFRIWIYTGNINHLDKEDNPKFQVMRTIGEIAYFLDNNQIPYEKILQTKPPAAFIIDDRAIHHKGWNNTLMEISRRCNIVDKKGLS